MQVIENKVITLSTVEINFNEFWEALENLVSDFKCDRVTFLLGSHIRQEALKKFVNENEIITLEIARDLFHSHPLQDLVRDIVIDYIAKSNGYSVNHYGLYDGSLDICSATFQRNGNHI